LGEQRALQFPFHGILEERTRNPKKTLNPNNLKLKSINRKNLICEKFIFKKTSQMLGGARSLQFTFHGILEERTRNPKKTTPDTSKK